MRDYQSVAGMADEVLERWTKARAFRTGESFEDVLEAIPGTEAGRHLREPGSGGLRRRERAHEWQASVAQERACALGRRSLPGASDLSTGG